MDFFVVKKLVSTFVAPLPIALFMLTLACLASWFSRSSKWVRWPLVFAWLLLVPLSLYPVASSWLMKFEGLYPTYQKQEGRSVEQIMVLACYAIEDPLLPLSSQVHSCSRGRLVEAMRIWRIHPNADILLSGGAMRFGHQSMAQISANLLITLGVPEDKIKVIEQGRDTNSEVVALKRYLGPLAPVLVTSATHMKRAVRLFARHGISVIPAPAEHLILAPSSHSSGWQTWVPKPYNLYRSDRAWYATLGNTLVTLQGIWGDTDELSQLHIPDSATESEQQKPIEPEPQPTNSPLEPNTDPEPESLQ